MKYFIRFDVFKTITNDAEVKQVREGVGKQIQHVQNSGKLVAGGIFANKRGGFMLLNIDKPFDIYELLGGAILDKCDVEGHVVLSFEELGEFFRKYPIK